MLDIACVGTVKTFRFYRQKNEIDLASIEVPYPATRWLGLAPGERLRTLNCFYKTVQWSFCCVYFILVLKTGAKLRNKYLFVDTVVKK